MKILHLCLLSVVLFSNVYAEETGRFKFELAGYTNTPYISGSEFRVHQKDRPQPRRVMPSSANEATGFFEAPSDAIILFDGSSMDHFQNTSWILKDGVFIAGSDSLLTKEAFGNCQLHVEWRAPAVPSGRPCDMGNSGIFLMGLYELQVYDSYAVKIYADGAAAAIYGQTPPMVNVCRPSGEWQSYDVVFMAPEFKEGKLIEAATITVLYNGVIVHNNTKILGPTAHGYAPPYKAHAAKLPISFQGHNSPVEYRNIWIRSMEVDQ